jgi:hypothetical protein
LAAPLEKVSVGEGIIIMNIPIYLADKENIKAYYQGKSES